jgi:hypothetical protein
MQAVPLRARVGLVVEEEKIILTLAALEQRTKDTLVEILAPLEQGQPEVVVPVLWVAMQQPLMKFPAPVAMDLRLP